ncbi:ANTAR domain-containing protein [Streptomyces sp. NPDC050523]|uniref:ANTAR domain-containing protein n=1 Tax=Streptomyces sp. NPDC050523 TaxID=3365622 RepID=UPI0037A4F288
MTQEQAAPLLGGGTTRDAALSVRPAAGRVEILCLSGVLDADGAVALTQDLAGHTEKASRAGRHLVLDLTNLGLVSAAAVRVLDTRTRHLGKNPVVVIATAPHVQALFSPSPPPGLRVYPTLGAALAALTPAGSRVEVPIGGEDLQAELFGLHAKIRTGPLIGTAQGVLLERYALADADAAFGLLKQASQRHNVPMRVLASAVVTAPPPAASSPEWFPGRLRTPPPPLELLGGPGFLADDRKHVLRTLVYEAVTLADADGAEVHLSDRALENSLVLEAQAGLDAAYRDRLALVSGPPAVCAQARDLGEPVFVADIAADPDLAGAEEGLAALATGSRALYAVPALTETGECAGVVCVHRMRPGRWMTAAQHTALAILADDLAAWRTWYRRTVVPEALEYVHAHAPHRG